MSSSFSVTAPEDFSFISTVFSHGWSVLQPFSFSLEEKALQCVIACPTKPVSFTIRETSSGLLAKSHTKISSQDRNAAKRKLAEMFHFELNLGTFYALIKRHPDMRWMARRKAGRFIRGETFFEDVVKMILTTNCSWSLTTTVNERLISTFGAVTSDGLNAFPTPEAIAQSSERFLREKIKLGYRAPYVLELSKRVAKGQLHVEAFRYSKAPANELYKELRTIKGVGDYAAGNLLKLLGRFDYLGLDSWCRMKFSELHGNGKSITDKDIHSKYDSFGEWRGLALWLDLTRQWYLEKFPL